MFKLIFGLFLGTIIVFESFKYSICNNFVKSTTNQKFVYFFDVYNVYSLVYLYFFIKIFVTNLSLQIFCIFLYASVLFINKYLSTIQKKHCNLLFVLTSLAFILFNNQNLGSYIIVAELFSILMFLILFFTNNFFTENLSLGAFYFISLNIVTFLFGVIFVVLVLCTYGSLNIENLVFFNQLNQNIYLTVFFSVYTILKLGQGPAVFFKFKFYKFTNIFNLIYYLFTYVILVWPYLLLILLKVYYTSTSVTCVMIPFVATIFLLQSIFFSSNITDFLVFSTWVFIWYQTVYTILYVKELYR